MSPTSHEQPPRRLRKDPPPADWREITLSRLREVIQSADPDAKEEVKWRKPSQPEGVPVWTHDGIVCIGNVLKSAVRLTFPKGAQIRDPTTLFNTRLDSRTVRAVDYREGEPIREPELTRILRQAVELNGRTRTKR